MGSANPEQALPQPLPRAGGELRTDWTRAEITALFDLPFDELMFRAQTVHRAHHAAGEAQLCTLLSIKTGGCPEDCGYCSQSASADTQLKAEKLMEVQTVLASAAEAKAAGSQRFCMGAAWRNPNDRDMDKVIAGGVIPAQDYQTLRDAGVQAIFGPGTNLVEAAEEVLRLLGHNMPPQEEAAE